MDALRSTSPWIKFMGIMGMIAIGFILIAAIYMSTLPFVGGSFALVYFILAVVCFFPALFLIQYSSLLGSYTRSKNPGDLERAFVKQKSYWIYVGILTIIYIALVLIMILAGGAAGLLGGGLHRGF